MTVKNNTLLTPENKFSEFQKISKYCTILAIILSMFIIIPKDHGVIPLGLVDIAIPFMIIDSLGFEEASQPFLYIKDAESVSFKLYVIMSTIGKIILIISFFLKSQSSNIILKIIGILMLLGGFFNFIINHSHLTFSFALITATPFLFMASIVLLINVVYLFKTLNG